MGDMNTCSFHFNLGTFKCTAVADGTNAYSVEWFFVNAPQAQLEQVLKERHLPLKEFDTPYTCLLINAHGRRILVDAGMGKLTPSAGKLLHNLKAEGIAPADIDTVILTHAHRDHCGGSVDEKGVPTFPRARYVMFKAEWDFWTDEAHLAEMEEQRAAFIRKTLLPLREQLDLLEGEADILPGIRAIPAFGHSPGHMVVSVTSGSEELLYTSDALIHPLHLEYPHWGSDFDWEPEQAAATMRGLLERVTARESLVHAFHFPFPGLGRVVQKGDAWQWQPVDV
jgi:glyoxylase-like metal-dependent hydrolase (beta-lactamase superfamily II)